MVLAEDFDFPRVWPRVWQCWFAAKSTEFGVARRRPSVHPRFRLRPCPPSFLAGFCFLSAP